MLIATSFPGFSPTRPTDVRRVGENPGNEVVLIVSKSSISCSRLPSEKLKLEEEDW